MKRQPVMVGEGADFFSVEVPGQLSGKTLADSGIGARTGLVVIAIEEGGDTQTNPPPDTVLKPEAKLLLLGTNEQRQRFSEAFA